MCFRRAIKNDRARVQGENDFNFAFSTFARSSTAVQMSRGLCDLMKDHSKLTVYPTNVHHVCITLKITWQLSSLAVRMGQDFRRSTADQHDGRQDKPVSAAKYHEERHSQNCARLVP